MSQKSKRRWCSIIIALIEIKLEANNKKRTATLLERSFLRKNGKTIRRISITRSGITRLRTPRMRPKVDRHLNEFTRPFAEIVKLQKDIEKLNNKLKTSVSQSGLSNLAQVKIYLVERILEEKCLILIKMKNI